MSPERMIGLLIAVVIAIILLILLLRLVDEADAAVMVSTLR